MMRLRGLRERLQDSARARQRFGKGSTGSWLASRSIMFTANDNGFGEFRGIKV